MSDLNQQIGLFVAKTGTAALNKTDAAKFLGMSVDFFDDHIEGEIPFVRRGRRRLYRVSDLMHWLEDSVEPATRPQLVA